MLVVLIAESMMQTECETHELEELWHESVRMQNTSFAEQGPLQHPEVSGSSLSSLKKIFAV